MEVGMASTKHPDPGRDGPDVSAPGLQVLVVEDDPDLAAVLARWLGRCGHEARVAPDGPTALQAASSLPPDVVLLDLGLPGMDGLEVARRVHEGVGPAAAKAPLVIAVTGRHSEEDRRRSEEAGIDLHLIKPVDVGLLHRVLQRFQGIIA
jgi:CheY-like chemotaxis protein